MSLGFWFWLIYVVAYFWGGWQFWWPQGRFIFGWWSVFWLLLGILGWKEFGSPWSVLVHG